MSDQTNNLEPTPPFRIDESRKGYFTSCVIDNNGIPVCVTTTRGAADYIVKACNLYALQTAPWEPPQLVDKYRQQAKSSGDRRDLLMYLRKKRKGNTNESSLTQETQNDD